MSSFEHAFTGNYDGDVGDDRSPVFTSTTWMRAGDEDDPLVGGWLARHGLSRIFAGVVQSIPSALSCDRVRLKLERDHESHREILVVVIPTTTAPEAAVTQLRAFEAGLARHGAAMRRLDIVFELEFR